MFKKSIYALDVIFLILIFIAPGLFIPPFIIGKNAGSIAVIGDSGKQTSVIFSAEPTQWGNVLFPLLAILVVCNFHLFIAFLIKHWKNDYIV
jgi:hypothetical protein